MPAAILVRYRGPKTATDVFNRPGRREAALGSESQLMTDEVQH